MGFLDRFRRGSLFFKKEMPDVVVKFTFMDNTYIVEDFDINFNQELNEKGTPGGLPRGGIMHLSFGETPDYYINEWIIRPDLPRDGMIQFFPNKGRVEENAMLIILFKEAYCIGYQKKIDTFGAGLSTTLTISPKWVKIGNEEFENEWKEQERLSHYIRSGK